MLKEIIDIISTDCDKFLKEYFISLIDTTNISSFFRVVQIGGLMSFFAQNFIEGGNIDINIFADSFSDPYAKLTKALQGTVYFDMAEKIEKGDLSVYETSQDNYLLKIFSANKNDMFSVAPIVGYYLAKLNEIKVIRVVLVCIKNKVAKDIMKKRVRVLYA